MNGSFGFWRKINHGTSKETFSHLLVLELEFFLTFNNNLFLQNEVWKNNRWTFERTVLLLDNILQSQSKIETIITIYVQAKNRKYCSQEKILAFVMSFVWHGLQRCNLNIFKKNWSQKYSETLFPVLVFRKIKTNLKHKLKVP